MAERTPSEIRNIAVVGHGEAGKTTLVDHLLYAAGAVNRAGDVDAGTSWSDYDPEEKHRHFSIDSTIFNFKWDGKTFNLIDTPGYLEFVGPALAVMPVVESVLLTVSATDGVLLGTRNMWEAAGKKNLTRAIVITHLDSENVRLEACLAEIQENFGRNCTPLLLPIGQGHDISGVVDLLDTEEAPEGVTGDFNAFRETLIESIIECDDSVMERYLEGEEIGKEQLRETFRKAMTAGQIVPVLCCAPKKGIGLKEILRFIADCMPSPLDGPPRKATDQNGEQVELRADPNGPFCAQVFKSVMDVHVGKLAFFRVFSGSLGSDATVQLARTGKTERLGHLYCVFGQEQKEVSEAVPGDILCVSKVEELQISDTLCDQRVKLVMEPIELPKPMMSLAVAPRSRDDEEKISAGLQKLAEGDPTFNIERDRRSSEIIITGMSNLHLEVMLGKLKRRYDIDVDTHEPSVPYLETITRKAEAKYRHKKQTGGHGQYGEVYLRIEPLETGLLAGCPIVDLKATLYYGSYHSVDSSEAAFKIAASKCFQLAFEEARPVLLEPIARMEVTIPPRYVGDVTANLTGHRGRIQSMDQVGQMQVIVAEIPVAEIQRYSAELKSMTGGEGSFTLEPSHYEVVPAHLQQQIIAARQAKEKEKEK